MIENKFAEGTTVYALAQPNEKLIVKRYIKRIYYCTTPAHPDQKELALFEREITDVADPAAG
ncbi:hypothetical protein RT717_14055 [Imperialibacter roseus]|uniref:Uncharacterized protein n=1 Tax=Imperialibacter roseus TaxID=1324217 RepID=A0ABZ0IJ69_9BACT|nr:hypothetical protein [Imperialibacter roseus]WOK04199.1 hypothetical protein RT717_14055 [Imperialibacter roseus]